MKNYIEGWAGTQWPPAAHESSFSVCLRLSWRNVWNAKKISLNLTGKGLANPAKSFLTSEWIRKTPISGAKWEIPNEYECNIVRNLGNSTSMFFAHRLRVCPLCFGDGFHSSWHQFKLLKFCPLHSCELVERCQQCLCDLAEYRLSKELFDAPYRCGECGGFIAGVEPQIETFLKHREEVNSDRSYDPIVDWFRLSESHLFLFRSATKCTKLVNGINYARKAALLIDFADELHSFPAELSHNFRNPGLTLLAWNIRAQVESNTGYLPNRREVERMGVNRRMARVLYVLTVRRLQAWVQTAHTAGDLADAIGRISTSQELELEHLSTRAIAYVLFRAYFESWPRYFTAGNFETVNFRFNSCPPFQLYLYERREPRLAYYAIYFAIYAELYWQIDRARALGKLRDVRKTHLDHLLTKFLLRSKTHIAGGVVFRTVPDLPLPRFLTRSVEQAKQSFTAAAGYKAVEGAFG